jgi:Tfp pilus assembly protein PilE
MYASARSFVGGQPDAAAGERTLAALLLEVIRASSVRMPMAHEAKEDILMHSRRCSTAEAGFTLIELGPIVAIIAVLSLVAGQTARLNVVFLPAVQKAPAQCTVNLEMFNQDGTKVASSTATLLPNQSASLTLPSDPTAVEMHAAVGVPACPDNSTTCSTDEQRMQAQCSRLKGSFLGSLEVVDVASGKTVVALPAVQ